LQAFFSSWWQGHQEERKACFGSFLSELWHWLVLFSCKKVKEVLEMHPLAYEQSEDRKIMSTHVHAQPGLSTLFHSMPFDFGAASANSPWAFIPQSDPSK
jgi:hypothetical protein